jgi:hypothetical protein
MEPGGIGKSVEYLSNRAAFHTVKMIGTLHEIRVSSWCRLIQSRKLAGSSWQLADGKMANDKRQNNRLIASGQSWQVVN